MTDPVRKLIKPLPPPFFSIPLSLKQPLRRMQAPPPSARITPLMITATITKGKPQAITGHIPAHKA